ncbi:MAG: hypothetical protein HN342_13490, partial [Nitrospina sp.]|nr:hypothetical protein [Nitrospina sp.]
LKTGSGTPVGEGYKNIHFRIYDATEGGTLIWARTQRAHTDADGLFNVVLMEGGTPIDDAQTESLAEVFTSSGGENRYLELTVDTSNPIMPRQRFITAPYAFMAGDVQNAKENFTVQGALTVLQGAHVKSLTVDNDASVGGALTAKSLTVDNDASVEGNLTVSGYNFFQANTGYDVWIQGGQPGNVEHGDPRNLALLGDIAEDLLHVNYQGEYAAGTVIGGPVSIGGWETHDYATSGYVDLGGFYIQWGYVDTYSNDQTINFPKSFPNACLSVVCNWKARESSPPVAASWTKTNFRLLRPTGWTGGCPMNYIAVGH